MLPKERAGHEVVCRRVAGMMAGMTAGLSRKDDWTDAELRGAGSDGRRKPLGVHALSRSVGQDPPEGRR